MQSRSEPPRPPPEATLFMSSGCTHCPSVMAALCRLLKENAIGRLEILNIAHYSDRARAAGVRSVPWTRIGRFELTGTHDYRELASWAEDAATGRGWDKYFSTLLETGRLEKTVALLRQHPDAVTGLLTLLQTLDTPMAVRIGVGAVVEELADEGLPPAAVPPLIALAESAQPQIRADACHYLSLVDVTAARMAIEKLLNDPDPQVREIARESLAGGRGGF